MNRLDKRGASHLGESDPYSPHLHIDRPLIDIDIWAHAFQQLYLSPDNTKYLKKSATCRFRPPRWPPGLRGSTKARRGPPSAATAPCRALRSTRSMKTRNSGIVSATNRRLAALGCGFNRSVQNL